MSRLSTLLTSEMPVYSVTVPSSGKKIEFKPFRVKEEKVLLLALEEGTEEAMLRAIINIIENCCNDIEDASDMPAIDIEYLFLKLRAKSIGDTVNPIITCPYTEEKIQKEINLNDVVVVNNKNISNKIKVTENIGVTLNHPTVKLLLENNFENFSYMGIEDSLKVIALSLEEIWTKEEVFNSNDLTIDERLEFLEQLSPDSFEEIINFFEDAPSLEYKLKYETSDGEERELSLTSFEDFFA